MAETNNNNKKKKRTWLWILLGVVVLIALLVGWRIISARQSANQALADIETEPYQRKTLSANIFGTGTVQPSQSAVLTWSASGIVGDINVSVGQSIKKDAVLMSLDPDSLSVDILQAEIDLINAQNALDDLQENWASELAQAKLDLIYAEEDLEDLETQRNITNYRRCSDERIEEMEDDLSAAERFYQFKQTPETLQAVNTAQANLNYCLADYSEQEIAEAELEVELGEARLSAAQREVDKLADGPDPDRMTILETQLAMAQSRLDSPLIEAPFEGVVTVLAVQSGDVVKIGNQAVQLDDLSELRLNVQISEIDIPLVAVGQTAELVFDAYFESVYNGEVTEIAPIGTPVQGVVEYAVEIKLLDSDARIKPGMTAAVNIVVEEKEDVFVIPNNAIVTIDGQEHVYVRRNGDYEAVPVTLGSYSDMYSEAVSADIAEGELIVINPPFEVSGNRPFGGPPSGGFGGFGN